LQTNVGISYELCALTLPAETATIMALTIHEIAPDSDNVIVLKLASNSFAQWPSLSELEGEVADAADASPIELDSACEEQKEPPAESKGQNSCEIHYRVSFSHLIQSSPWFKRVLGKGGWSESRAVDGRYRIVAEDWDETALLTVLNIVHLRNRQVPKVVSLEEMAKIGVIADYYECGEAIEMFTTLWTQNLKRLSFRQPTAGSLYFGYGYLSFSICPKNLRLRHW
jgi:hypothetical protein